MAELDYGGHLGGCVGRLLEQSLDLDLLIGVLEQGELVAAV